MSYGLLVNENFLTKGDIVGISYIQENSGSIGTDVNILSLNTDVWPDYVETQGPPGSFSAVLVGTEIAKEVNILDSSLNESNLFLSVHSSVDNLNNVLLEKWTMPGYFSIYNKKKHKIYNGIGSSPVTSFFGATS